jgi:hypothetical protein
VPTIFAHKRKQGYRMLGNHTVRSIIIYILHQIKEKEMGYVCTTQRRNEKKAHKSCSKIPNGRDNLRGLGRDGRIILRWILGNNVFRCILDSFVSVQGSGVGSCEHGHELFCSIKGGEFLG